ncbi:MULTISPECIES: Rrf2 family transcriptional regulator [unclassified Plantactinospora]|uniref:RrF2 family transcriptional regulator n=1 Tax=unclassified Plantactinospora TaxID=2631981 RepID=UPI000D150D79|nr:MULTISPECIES: Rrf2 family transcriptional regulator [unclassified Plantactinospora]AVT32609.1 transcriptional regulator [Plantactinospora sp. BC1]AVT39247.1 transcriptional regulator [Plantactinospora sp. BB1]
MRLSARVDYALRAVAEIAARAEAGGADPRPAGGGRLRSAGPAGDGAATGAHRRPVPLTAEQIARAQDIPPKFLESILLQMRRGGIVHAQRGPEGGYWLARPATEISLAEIIRVIDGPLANIRGQRPEDLGYSGAARALQEVWIALRASEREILELVTIADVANGKLPDRVRDLAADPAAWT